MKRMLPTTQYTFSVGGNLIDFSTYPDFDPKRVLAVINTSIAQTLIYATGGGSSSPTGGTFYGALGGYYLTLTFNCSAAGMSDADILQIIYDESVGMEEAKASIDIVSGKAGLDVNLLNSSFGGTLGDVMPAPFQDNALSIGILSGGVLEAPTININNELVVDATQSGNVPVYVSGGGVSISGSVSNIQYNSSGTEVTYNQGSSDNSTTRVAANIYNNGAALDYGTGAASTNTLRTYSNIALNGTNISTGTGGTDSGTIRVSANLYQATSGLFTTSGIVLSGYNLISNSPAGTDVSGYKSFSIQVNSTATGGAYIFEGSNDASTYKAIPVSNSDSITGTIMNSAITATSSTIIYYGKVNFKFLRVRTTSAITGGSLGANTILSMFDLVPVVQNIVQPDATKLNVTLGAGSSAIGSVSVTGTAAISAASLPLPTGAATEGTVVLGNAVLTSIDSRLITINNKIPAIGAAAIASSMPVNIASDQIVPISAPDLYVTGQSAQTVIVNNIIPSVSSSTSIDAANYKSASVQVVSTGTAGTFIFEGSNDNVNFQAIPVFNQSLLNGGAIVTAITATASQIIYLFPIQMKYIRLRIATTITGGSIQAFTRLTQSAFSPATTLISQATAGNLNVTASGTVTSTVALATLAASTTTDIASAAITTTVTSANLALTGIQSMSILASVTIVSGTTPTLDIILQETLDGTNYYDIYHFPRITATGQYTTPVLKLTGIGYRVVRTVSGTTPSFTMSLARISRQVAGTYNKSFINRTIDPNTLNSTSPVFITDGCDRIHLCVSMAAGGTVSPMFKVQGSEDQVGWYDLSSMTITSPPSSSLAAAYISGIQPKFCRVITMTAGTGAVLSQVCLKAMGN